MLRRIYAQTQKETLIEIKAIRGEGEIISAQTDEPDSIEEQSQILVDEGYNLFFHTALKKVGLDSGRKESCYGTNILWVDIDRESFNPDIFLLPPSYVVRSGLGFHIYWQLDEYITSQDIAEKLLKKLCKIFDGDKSLAQINALLRIPNTLNYKYNPPKKVTILDENGFIYTKKEIEIAVSAKWMNWLNRAKTEIDKGFRSEHEFVLAKNLNDVGFTKETSIHILKSILPETSKVRETEDNQYNDSEFGYLERTMDKVISHEGNPLDIYEGEGIYFAYNDKGNPVILSNFIYELKAIQNNNGGMGNCFIVDIHAGNSVWKNQVVHGKDFTTSSTFCNSLPHVQMSWLGSDIQTRKFKMFLSEKWENEGLPLINVTNQLGRQYEGTKEIYVTNETIYDKEMVPVYNTIYVAPQHEHPIIDIYAPIDPVTMFKDLLQVNDQTVIKSIMGWVTAAMVKPVLMELGIKFPHLLVSGSKGAGKTTLITEIFQPLMGYKNLQIWQANSTPFVLMTLMGATTSIPICLTEFRQSTQTKYERFLSTLRTAYDFGLESRGKADLSTVTYALSAPICIDGEEITTDPALLERIIAIHLDKRQLQKHTNSIDKMRTYDLHGMGAYILNHTLTNITKEELNKEYKRLQVEFKNLPIPQRIKNNYAVVNTGLYIINKITKERGWLFSEETIIPNQDLVIESAKLPIFGFLETLINNVTRESPDQAIFYKFSRKKDNPTFAFHFASCYAWYSQHMQKMGKSLPDEYTMKKQLKELDDIFVRADTMAEERTSRPMHMYEINLSNASQVMDIEVF